MFSGITDSIREVRSLVRLQRQALSDRLPVVAYAEDIATWSVLGPYLERVVTDGERDVVYVTSAPTDPQLARRRQALRAIFLSRAVPQWLPRLNAGLFLTTMPDLGSLNVARPPAITPCVYAFHSLVSTHEAYRPGAFDHYDVFFCAGPHHRLELEAHFRRTGGRMPELMEVGYARLDDLSARVRSTPPRAAGVPLVLVAPSWGAGNLLEVVGVDVVARLREAGFRVIVRPHPCFWLPLYPAGRQHVARVIDRFRNDPDVVVQHNIDSDAAYLEADLLISDFSGAAYEYAFATRRPVLFIDGARKTLNPGWRELGLPTFEDTMRREVGELINPAQIGEVGRAAERLLLEAPAWADRLAELHRQHVYNPGRSSEIGASALRGIASRRRTSDRAVS